MFYGPFVGGVGTDLLLNVSGGGANVFLSGRGVTSAFGGYGADTYSYVAGDGLLVINEQGGANSLVLGAGIARSAVSLIASGTDLLIEDGTAGDQIVLAGQLSINSSAQVQTLVFGDGSTMSLTGLALSVPAGATVLEGTPGGDTLTATAGTQTLIGNGGGDTFIGGTGTAVLIASQGYSGANVFVSGKGVTSAVGNYGNDTYSYAAGDGTFVISAEGGANRLVLGAGLTSANVTLTASGTDLLIGDGTARP